MSRLSWILIALIALGMGVAWFWPWSQERYFLPWRPIEVSPFIKGFFSARGLRLLASEARWVWLPCLAVALSGFTLRHLLLRSPQRDHA